MLLTALWVISLIGTIPRFVMAFYQTQITEDLDVGRSFVSFTWSFNLFITAICLPIGGMLVDRFGPKKMLVVSRFIGVIGAIVTYFAEQNALYFFLGFGVLFGLTGLSATTEFTLLFQWFKHKRATANTVLRSASPLGLAILSPIFVANKGWLTWNDAFLLTSVLGLLISIPLIQLVIKDPETDEHEKKETITPNLTLLEKSKEMVSSFQSPLMVAVVLALFACGFNMGTVEMNLVAIHEHAAVPIVAIGYALTLLGVMDVLGSFFFGYLLDRYSRTKVLAILYLLRTIGFLLLLFHLPVSPIIFSILFGATYVGAVPGSLLVAREQIKQSNSQTGSLLLIHSVGGIVGSLFGGFVYDLSGNYQILIASNIILCLLTVISYLFAQTHLKKRTTQAAVSQ